MVVGNEGLGRTCLCLGGKCALGWAGLGRWGFSHPRTFALALRGGADFIKSSPPPLPPTLYLLWSISTWPWGRRDSSENFPEALHSFQKLERESQRGSPRPPKGQERNRGTGRDLGLLEI